MNRKVHAAKRVSQPRVVSTGTAGDTLFQISGRKRVVIERIRPNVNGGLFPIKRIVGETVEVKADIFADGHDVLRANLLYRTEHESDCAEIEMTTTVNDRWEASFCISEQCTYYYTIEAWIDHFASWQKGLKKKFEAGQDVVMELKIGAALIEKAVQRADDSSAKELSALAAVLRKGKPPRHAFEIATGEKLTSLMNAFPDRSNAAAGQVLTVTVDRPKALFSAWYEIFPRSCGKSGHGTFDDCARRLPRIAEMGFDIVYLPPIHPIGVTNRKGKNNIARAAHGDPGSPWAIGSDEGGHTAIHPSLGTMQDFKRLTAKAAESGMEIAIDIAFQCSPDHPYIKQHPGWFRHRPDGTIQFAENPPKKYEDIVPFDFECDDWQGLWRELTEVVLYWARAGVLIFRVDNPHTKPFAFWEYLIDRVKREFPGAMFLAEAFTRPKVMHRLAKIGFTQSYTYFTWRTTKKELTEYLTELSQTGIREFFRPNFWPNTPDILHESLQIGGRGAFIVRLVLAATLSSNYGMYGPLYELCEHEAYPGREEYNESEKYEIHHWDLDRPGNIRGIITAVNAARRENPALQTTFNIEFVPVDNDNIIAYVKTTADLSNIVLVVVNLDPNRTQCGWVNVPVRRLGMDVNQMYYVHDQLSGARYSWRGEQNYVQLDPRGIPAHVFVLNGRAGRATDYYL